MHEGHFTDQIVSEILNQVRLNGGRRAARVRVKVGEMFHLEPESVRMHFDMAAKGTPLEGTALVLEEMPSVAKCGSCGHEGALEDHHVLMCMQCGARGVKLTGGNSIVVESIEFEEPVT